MDAAAADPPARREALEQLCQAYWLPIYSFARRQGASPEVAADRTQGFFAQLLDRNSLDAADPRRGRFRTFLLSAFQNYCRNEHRNEHAQKRGGDARAISIDVQSAESRCRVEPSTELTPELLYERQWAMALLDRVFERLAEEFAESGRAALLETLQPRLSGVKEPTYAEIAERFGMTETAVKVVAYRMRNRFGELLRDEVAQTVEQPSDVEDELRRLFTLFQ